VLELNFVPDAASSGVSGGESVAATSVSSDESAARALTEELLARRFDPDGRAPRPLRRMWPETSEDDASTEDHISEIWRRHDDESSDDGGAGHVMTQYVASLTPLEGEKNFEVDGFLRAEFAIPQKGSVWRERNTVDSNLVVCEPPQEVRVFWKSSTVIEIVPVGRWRASTSYCVHVAAAVVNKLDDASGFTFSFHTQSLRVELYTRSSREDPLRPVFKLVPNQKVDVPKLLAGITLTSRPKGVTGFIVSSVTRFQRSTHTFSLLRESPEFIELCPVGPLPPNSVAELLLAAGSYSNEGPNPSEESCSVEFATYPPLTIVSRHPSYFHKITPGEPWRINFSNDLRIEPELLHSMVEISPPIPFAVSLSPQSRLCITPETEAFATYTVTLSASIGDVFGQQLNVADTFTSTTGQWPPFDGVLKSASEMLLVTHPVTPGVVGSRVFQYSSFNVSSVRERAFVLAGDALPLSTNVEAKSVLSSSEDVVEWIKKNGKCVIDKQRSLSRVHSSGSVSDWNSFDWSEAFQDKTFGRLCILVELGDSLVMRLHAQGKNPNHFAVTSIVQCTSIAISAVVHRGTCVIAVSRLSDGMPVVGAQVREADGGGKLGITNQGGTITTTSRLPDKRIMAISPTDASDVCFFVLPSSSEFEVSHSVCSFVLDRQVYFPLDKVQCKLWARACAPPLGENLILFDNGSLLIWRCVRLYSSDSHVEVASGASVFNSFSSCLVSFELPEDMAPGKHAIKFYSDVVCWNEHDSLIGECELLVEKPHCHDAAFRSEVVVTALSASSEQAIAFLDDGSAIATVTTCGPRGGARLRGAQVKWSAFASDEPVRVPANMKDFVFGLSDLITRPESLEVIPGPLVTELGSSGASRLAISWSGGDVFSRPVRVKVKATVQDLFQSVSSSEGSFLILPSAEPLVGIKQNLSWIYLGEKVVLD
jgi:hypothetical protein